MRHPRGRIDPALLVQLEHTLCDFLYSGELITDNPMPLIGRPKVAKTLPKGLGADTISELLRVIDEVRGSGRRSEWAERDRAIVLTAVLAGLRADELMRANVGDIRPADDGGVIHVRGKGNKDRRIPLEQALIHELELYLESRPARFPGSTKRRPTNGGLAAWPATAALFVSTDGQRITRGTLQYRMLRAFKKAGLNSHRAAGVLVHGFRHLRHRARQPKRQRVRADEASRTRVDGDLAALRRRRGNAEPRGSCPEPALRPGLNSLGIRSSYGFLTRASPSDRG